MPTPLPIELRIRAVNAYGNGEGSVHEIAERFSICARSLFRWLAIERCGNDLSPKRYRHGFAAKISPDEYSILGELCSEKSDRTIEELAQAWCQKTGKAVSRSAMGRALLKAGLTLKKRRFGQSNEIEKMFGLKNKRS
jgi:transposase